jgi:hypothetical protein
MSVILENPVNGEQTASCAAQAWLRAKEENVGGYGSGRPREKEPVEDCRVLSAGMLQRNKVLGERLFNIAALTWTNAATGENVSSIGCLVDTIGAVPLIRLSYEITRTGENVDYPVRLTTTPLPWGGFRWAFLCPGWNCGRACRKLYLPPGGRYFACRLCYRLTYTSTQEAHTFDRFLNRLTR